MSLGNQVWFDYNNNGLLETGEPGVPGVDVTLVYSGTTTVIATTTTDANGNYLFTGLTPGNYQVIIPASEFGSGQPLENYLSTTTTEP